MRCMNVFSDDIISKQSYSCLNSKLFHVCMWGGGNVLGMMHIPHTPENEFLLTALLQWESPIQCFSPVMHKPIGGTQIYQFVSEHIVKCKRPFPHCYLNWNKKPQWSNLVGLCKKCVFSSKLHCLQMSFCCFVTLQQQGDQSAQCRLLLECLNTWKIILFGRLPLLNQ